MKHLKIIKNNICGNPRNPCYPRSIKIKSTEVCKIRVIFVLFNETQINIID